MTIEVKASKQSAPNEEPRKRFEFFSREKMTSLPVHIGLVIVAFAAYFRHLLSPTAPAQLTQDDGAPKGAESDDTAGARTRLRNERPERDRPDVEPDGQKAVSELDDYDVASTVDWSPSILASEPAGGLHFARPPSGLQPISIFPAAFGFELSNDNGGHFRAPSADISKPIPIGGPDEPGHGSPEPHGPVDDHDDDGDQEEGRANRTPINSGPVRLNDIFAGQAVLIGLTQLLAGTNDPDGDDLLVTNVTAMGADFTASANGWVVLSEHGMLGPVNLSYQVSDGQAAVWQTAYFEIMRNAVVLSPADDLFVGTAYDDDIDALAGDDIVNAMEGNDLVQGGLGDDHLFGDDGDDVLRGGAGMDIIFGGEGDDVIHGGEDDDRLFGEGDRDTLFGDAGDDWLEGGEGDDILDGGDGNDSLLGGSGDDTLIGAAGADTLAGEAGEDLVQGGVGDDTLSGGDENDVLEGGQGNDSIDGGSGNDTVVGGGGNDDYDGGSDFDILSYAATEDDLTIDDRTGEASGAGIGEDTFIGFEQIHGGEGDDLFVIGASARIVSGGRGRDLFVFEVTDDDPELSENVVHDILDFVVGDRVRVRDYDISREAQAAEQDLFRSIYSDDDDDWLRSDFPILVGHDVMNGIDITIIRADLNSDDVIDVTINIRDVLLSWNNDPVSA